jgi:DNA-directed RNA polymerase specialized sigma24 family protein
MRRYNTRLYPVARTIPTNDGEAEDVMQDAYVRPFSTSTGSRDGQSFRLG